MLVDDIHTDDEAILGRHNLASGGETFFYFIINKEEEETIYPFASYPVSLPPVVVVQDRTV